MKKTLLELTNSVLIRMLEDPVNSINDTVASESVAEEIRGTCEAMWSNRNWRTMRQLLKLEASGTVSRPTHMRLPDRCKELISLSYNAVKAGETRKVYHPIKWLDPESFLRKVSYRNNDLTATDVILDTTGVELLIKNNRTPEFFTSFDEENIVFDSYDNTVDTTLQASKTQAEGYVFPIWNHDDDYIPDFPAEAFTAILEEAKSRCMLAFKQTQDIKAEQEAARQNRWLSRKQWRMKGGVQYPDYGRRGNKSQYTTRRYDYE